MPKFRIMGDVKDISFKTITNEDFNRYMNRIDELQRDEDTDRIIAHRAEFFDKTVENPIAGLFDRHKASIVFQHFELCMRVDEKN